jgi:ADP-heptose:LPS heptosyltransferase
VSPARGSADAADWSDVRRILCVRLDNFGDVLMTTPALRALRQARPDRELVLWTSRAGAAVGTHVPDVERCLAYDAPWVSHPQADAGAAADRAMLERLRAEDCDAAVIFTVCTQSALPAALMCRLAGIPRVLAHARENPYRLLSDRAPETDAFPDVRHEVQRQLDLVARVGARTHDTRLSFHVPRDAQERAEVALRAAGVDPACPFVLLHPGASAASRRYPAARFAEAVEQLRRRGGAPVVLTCGAAESALVREIQAGLSTPAPRIEDLPDLATLAAVLQKAAVFLGNNSGPAHLAAAVGTPVVDLYALTNPQHAPWGVPHRLLFHDVPCRWCLRSRCPEAHHACLEGVAPVTVADAVLELLGARGRTTPSHAVAA